MATVILSIAVHIATVSAPAFVQRTKIVSVQHCGHQGWLNQYHWASEVLEKEVAMT